MLSGLVKLSREKRCSGCGQDKLCGEFTESQVRKGELRRCHQCVKDKIPSQNVTRVTYNVSPQAITSPSAVSTFGAVALQRAFVPLSVYHEVMEENKTVRKEVKLLTDKNAELGLTILEVNLITQLEEQNRVLKQELATLKKQMAETSSYINSRRKFELFRGFMFAIQDLNREDSLESKLCGTASALVRLRQRRVGDTHFINETDEPKKKDYKKFALYGKLKSMPFEIRQAFDKKYPGVVGSVIAFMKRHGRDSFSGTPSADWIAEVEDWWNEIVGEMF